MAFHVAISLTHYRRLVRVCEASSRRSSVQGVVLARLRFLGGQRKLQVGAILIATSLTLQLLMLVSHARLHQECSVERLLLFFYIIRMNHTIASRILLVQLGLSSCNLFLCFILALVYG